MAQIIGVSQVMWPFHMVPTQLKNFIPVGTAIRKVMNEKNGSRTAPVTNMWCAHTAMDSAPMARSAKTMAVRAQDRKSTRLNSSHVSISYAVFCLKKKKQSAHQ